MADRPRYLVLPLATLGGTASAANLLTGFGTGGEIVGWHTLLICVAGGVVYSIFNLYIVAFLIGWVGRKIGGVASNVAVRAVLAWGMLPSILGLALVLAIAAGWRVVAPGAEPKWLPRALDIVSGVSGLWSFVVVLLMLARVERFGFWRTVTAYVIGALLVSAGLALFVRTFLFQPFSLPAASMGPTLLPGDNVFATKYAYGYTHYSFPFSPPLFTGRIFGSEPARGDVVVFRLPKDNSTDYVKRVVGLPGDRIQIKSGELYINDVKVQRERLTDFTDGDLCGGARAGVKRWRETLPNGVSYQTLDCVDNGFYDNTNVYRVPGGHLFMLGDNRDNSTDSRVLSAVGYVPLENLVGRVGMIFFSRDAGGDGVPSTIRYGRIGALVR